MSNVRLSVLVGAATLAASAHAAHAFCGFYVAGSDKALVNDATQVVLMREGTRTVLSMQNDYKGPLDDFAMVVPVPVVLKQDDVKTLPKAVFEHVDSLGSPRLVEYWEQDPCYIPPPPAPMRVMGAGMSRPKPTSAMPDVQYHVKIEAKFDVGEYKILILSASDSTGLEHWLTDNHYRIPAGAAPLLRPYVEASMKFFVAKVDPKKVQMVDGHIALSPLRFHYDSDELALPIRLGMANSGGKQDLIVNILAANQRYEVANYKNVTVPTNFDVKDGVRGHFGEFYAALFDKTLEVNPKAVVTEYAWAATPRYHCDPCPPVEVTDADLMTLGGDVVGGAIAQGSFVLTRLHARYGKGDMNDDLRFRVAKPITGGREDYANGQVSYGVRESSQNNFQARYAIRHPWTGKIACQNPRRGIWGGPPNGEQNQLATATKLAFAPRGAFDMPAQLTRDLPEIGVMRGSSGGSKKPPAPADPNAPHFATPPGPGVKATSFGLGALGALALIGAGSLLARRRRTRSW